MKIEKLKPIVESFTITLTGAELLVITKTLGNSNDSETDGNYEVYRQLAAFCRANSLGVTIE